MAGALVFGVGRLELDKSPALSGDGKSPSGVRVNGLSTPRLPFGDLCAFLLRAWGGNVLLGIEVGSISRVGVASASEYDRPSDWLELDRVRDSANGLWPRVSP